VGILASRKLWRFSRFASAGFVPLMSDASLISRRHLRRRRYAGPDARSQRDTRVC
jgi:hypothetical protein